MHEAWRHRRKFGWGNRVIANKVGRKGRAMRKQQWHRPWQAQVNSHIPKRGLKILMKKCAGELVGILFSVLRNGAVSTKQSQHHARAWKKACRERLWYWFLCFTGTKVHILTLDTLLQVLDWEWANCASSARKTPSARLRLSAYWATSRIVFGKQCSASLQILLSVLQISKMNVCIYAWMHVCV